MFDALARQADRRPVRSSGPQQPEQVRQRARPAADGGGAARRRSQSQATTARPTVDDDGRQRRSRGDQPRPGLAPPAAAQRAHHRLAALRPAAPLLPGSASSSATTSTGARSRSSSARRTSASWSSPSSCTTRPSRSAASLAVHPGAERDALWQLRDATEILFLSWFVNCLVPAKLGDLYRAYLLRANYGASISRTVGHRLHRAHRGHHRHRHAGADRRLLVVPGPLAPGDRRALHRRLRDRHRPHPAARRVCASSARHDRSLAAGPHRRDLGASSTKAAPARSPLAASPSSWC